MLFNILINKANILTFVNYLMKGVIIALWIYLYYIGSLTLNRILIFILVFFLIIGYNRFAILINYIFLEKKLKKYIENHKEIFLKILYVLLEIHRWINPFIVFLVYTDKCLYKINRYITGTRLIRYNFVIYVLMKYYVMFGLIKLIIYKYYNFWYKFYSLTIIEILFKRMYGLILSILIFTDLFNNVIGFLSQYNVWIYIILYYMISTLCIIWELYYIFYLLYKTKYKTKYEKVAYVMLLFNKNFEEYTKMNIILFLRSQVTWFGCVISNILENLISKENNFKQDFVSITKVRDNGFIMSGRIAYYIPLQNRISLNYFDYFFCFVDFKIFEPTFEFYWKAYTFNLSYYSFFLLKREIRYKPSIFLYKNIQELLKSNYLCNQPISRFMDWLYFEMKYKENLNILNEDEKSIVNGNLLFLKKADKLRAKLMFFIIWDIEYFYNGKDKDYIWNYWNLQYNSMGEELYFIMDESFEIAFLSMDLNVILKLLSINNNKDELKFYDPEENMEFLNRLFNVLGIVNIGQGLSKEIKLKDNYYVSKKFMSYNEKYVELLSIMYTYDLKRWEEKLCACKYVSVYEVEIGYKTEEYFQNLRLEWNNSIEKESLEERNWRLLKSLEDLM